MEDTYWSGVRCICHESVYSIYMGTIYEIYDTHHSMKHHAMHQKQLATCHVFLYIASTSTEGTR